MQKGIVKRGDYTLHPAEDGYQVFKGKRSLGKVSYNSPQMSPLNYRIPDGRSFRTLLEAATELEASKAKKR